MKKIIEEMQRDNVVTIFYEDMYEEYVTGFVCFVNETELVLSCIDRYGENNGYLWLKLDGIYRMDFESGYERKLKFLYNQKRQQHQFIDFEGNGEKSSAILLQWAKQNNKTVELGFANRESEVCGYFEAGDSYKIKQIDKYECKPRQGSTSISLENVDYIWVDERRGRDAGMIYRWRRENNYEE